MQICLGTAESLPTTLGGLLHFQFLSAKLQVSLKLKVTHDFKVLHGAWLREAAPRTSFQSYFWLVFSSDLPLALQFELVSKTWKETARASTPDSHPDPHCTWLSPQAESRLYPAVPHRIRSSYKALSLEPPPQANSTPGRVIMSNLYSRPSLVWIPLSGPLYSEHPSYWQHSPEITRTHRLLYGERPTVGEGLWAHWRKYVWIGNDCMSMQVVWRWSPGRRRSGFLCWHCCLHNPEWLKRTDGSYSPISADCFKKPRPVSMYSSWIKMPHNPGKSPSEIQKIYTRPFRLKLLYWMSK